MVMRSRSVQWFLFLIGLCSCVAGLALMQPVPTYARSSEAQYVGSGDCADCHRDTARIHDDTAHALALFRADRQPQAVVGDFSSSDALLSFQFPGTDAARPVTLDDIRYVLGSGIHVQRYVIEWQEDRYALLPFEWNTQTGQWQPFQMAPEWSPEAYDFTTHCAGCHVTGLDAEALSAGEAEWEENGVQCEACHGAGSTHLELADEAGHNPSDEDLAAIRSAIYAQPDAQMCGQCHSRGVDPESSLPYPIQYRPGMNLLDPAVFVLADQQDRLHWWASGHASMTNMQFNEWLISGHGDALQTALASDYADDSCLTCHSVDPLAAREGQTVTLADVQYGVTCVSCHDTHPQEAAAQLLRAEPDALCAGCHSSSALPSIHHPTSEMVNGQPLIDSIEGVSTTHATVEGGPTCVSCHMLDVPTGTELRATHTFQPVLPGEADPAQTDTCTGCHTDLSRAYGQHFINSQQQDVVRRLMNIEGALETITPEQSVLDAVAFVSGDGSMGVHNARYTETLLNRAETALGLAQSFNPILAGLTPVTDPQECAECHTEEHTAWLGSLHANSSLQDSFQEAYAQSGQPAYCLRCHASGYNPQTQQFTFAGVVCTNCHLIEEGVEHPPAPISIADDPQVCGQCHSGGHASVYEEWLASEHAATGIDCVDCHTAHDNGLVLEDVNTTCGNCHQEAMADEIHMGENMICTDCHMTPRDAAPDPAQRTRTGHMMGIDPGVCADCHGNTHLLSRIGTDSGIIPEEVTALETQVNALQTRAEENLNNGLIGGAVGVLLLLGLIYLVLRLGRMR
jgi:predicted CXXCH cytochrome family protein